MILFLFTTEKFVCFFIKHCSANSRTFYEWTEFSLTNSFISFIDIVSYHVGSDFRRGFLICVKFRFVQLLRRH